MPASEFNDLDTAYTPETWFRSEDSDEEKGVVLGRFVERQIVDRPASRKAGEYIYKGVIGCYQKPATSNDISYSELTPATAPSLIKRYYSAWKAFDEQRDKPDGTTLLGVKFLKREDIIKLLGMRVETMEQLAALDEAEQKKFFGLPALQRQAASYLETAKERSGDPKDDMPRRSERDRVNIST